MSTPKFQLPGSQLSLPSRLQSLWQRAVVNCCNALFASSRCVVVMSIHGIGVDIAHIPRFVRLLSNHAIAARLQRKMLHPIEIQQLSVIQSAGGKVDRRAAEYVASRWAVKEAVTKAFGGRLLFPDIQLHSPNRSKRAARDAHIAASAPSSVPAPPSPSSSSTSSSSSSAAAAATAQPRVSADPRPSLHFHGQCGSLMAAAGVSAASSHVSLSHDGEYAIAFVTLVTLPTPL